MLLANLADFRDDNMIITARPPIRWQSRIHPLETKSEFAPMPTPLIRPGKASAPYMGPRIVAFFPYATLANGVIQWLLQIGIRSDQLGILPPENLPDQRGMVLAIGCPDPVLADKVETICRSQVATLVKRESAPPSPTAL